MIEQIKGGQPCNYKAIAKIDGNIGEPYLIFLGTDHKLTHVVDITIHILNSKYNA